MGDRPSVGFKKQIKSQQKKLKRVIKKIHSVARKKKQGVRHGTP
jgi:hypothetical protein